MKNCRVVLCGIGGYGHWYMNSLLEEGASHRCELIAGIDPYPDRAETKPKMDAAGIPIYPNLKTFFQNDSCDLVIVCSPIHYHAEQTCEALSQGAHVLCEKPLCSTEADVQRMARAEAASGLTVTVGYQWSFSNAIQRLKADCQSGRLGRPLRFRTLVCWPRDEAYYHRNSWAGCLRGAQGRVILDSPVNNATAHFLHNMLYVLGSAPAESALPVKLDASLFRANPIQSFDTAAVRISTETGVDLQFYVSHATEQSSGPLFRYEFENAVVTYDEVGAQIRGVFKNGEVIEYGSPGELVNRKLWNAVESARTGAVPLCGIQAARAHAACVNLIHSPERSIGEFPIEVIEQRPTELSTLRYVPGLGEALRDCFDAGSSAPLVELHAGLAVPLHGAVAAL